MVLMVRLYEKCYLWTGINDRQVQMVGTQQWGHIDTSRVDRQLDLTATTVLILASSLKMETWEMEGRIKNSVYNTGDFHITGWCKDNVILL